MKTLLSFLLVCLPLLSFGQGVTFSSITRTNTLTETNLFLTSTPVSGGTRTIYFSDLRNHVATNLGAATATSITLSGATITNWSSGGDAFLAANQTLTGLNTIQTNRLKASDGKYLTVYNPTLLNSFGGGSGNINASSNKNTGFGYGSLGLLSSGSKNSAFGFGALSVLTNAVGNSAFGDGAMVSFEGGGFNNSAFGVGALNALTTNSHNTAIGANSQNINQTGRYNTTVGGDSMLLNVSGQENVGVGVDALMSATGNFNTSIGTYSLQNLGVGDANIGVGYYGGKFLRAGTNNILIGRGFITDAAVLGITNGNGNIAIGNNVGDLPSNDGTNQLNIGNLIFSNGVTNGNSIAPGNMGIGVIAPATKLAVGGTMSSSGLLSVPSGQVTNSLKMLNVTASKVAVFDSLGNLTNSTYDAANVGVGVSGTTNGANWVASDTTNSVLADGVASAQSFVALGVGANKAPVGTTAQRPVDAAGIYRWNSTIGRFEVNTGSGWKSYVRLDGDTMTGPLLLQITNTQTTITPMLVLTNATDATVSLTVQDSPAQYWYAKSWLTGSASNSITAWRAYVLPVSSANALGSSLKFEYSINGAAFGSTINFTDSGVVNAASFAATGSYTVGATGSLLWATRGTKINSAATNSIETLANSNAERATLQFNIPQLTKTANYTLTLLDSGLQFDNIGAAATNRLDLPVAYKGTRYYGYVDAAFRMQFQAQGSDVIRDGASVSGAAAGIYSAAVGSTIELFAPKAGVWVVRSKNGAWTIE